MGRFSSTNRVRSYIQLCRTLTPAVERLNYRPAGRSVEVEDRDEVTGPGVKRVVPTRHAFRLLFGFPSGEEVLDQTFTGRNGQLDWEHVVPEEVGDAVHVVAVRGRSGCFIPA